MKYKAILILYIIIAPSLVFAQQKKPAKKKPVTPVLIPDSVRLKPLDPLANAVSASSQDTSRVFTITEISPRYKDGNSATWNAFVKKQTDTALLRRNKAVPGTYTVTVSFTVQKDGSLTDVQAENDPGFGTAQEAVRIITASSPWNPATRNGIAALYHEWMKIALTVPE